jgi:hypothetical protein
MSDKEDPQGGRHTHLVLGLETCNHYILVYGGQMSEGGFGVDKMKMPGSVPWDCGCLGRRIPTMNPLCLSDMLGVLTQQSVPYIRRDSSGCHRSPLNISDADAFCQAFAYGRHGLFSHSKVCTS